MSEFNNMINNPLQRLSETRSFHRLAKSPNSIIEGQNRGNKLRRRVDQEGKWEREGVKGTIRKRRNKRRRGRRKRDGRSRRRRERSGRRKIGKRQTSNTRREAVRRRRVNARRRGENREERTLKGKDNTGSGGDEGDRASGRRRRLVGSNGRFGVRVIAVFEVKTDILIKSSSRRDNRGGLNGCGGDIGNKRVR
jgi:hypothetical protein